jgi:hypothetical protein
MATQTTPRSAHSAVSAPAGSTFDARVAVIGSVGVTEVAEREHARGPERAGEIPSAAGTRAVPSQRRRTAGPEIDVSRARAASVGAGPGVREW